MSADPPRFETLDSLAFASGRQWDGHLALTIERMRLRLRRKEQGLPSVAWARGEKTFTLDFIDGWTRLVDPIRVPKARVAKDLVVFLTYDASDEVLLQVTTKASPLRLVSSTATGVGLQVIGLSGPGDDVTNALELPLLAGPEEEVTVYGRVRNGVTTLDLFGMSMVALRQTLWFT